MINYILTTATVQIKTRRKLNPPVKMKKNFTLKKNFPPTVTNQRRRNFIFKKTTRNRIGFNNSSNIKGKSVYRYAMVYLGPNIVDFCNAVTNQTKRKTLILFQTSQKSVTKIHFFFHLNFASKNILG